MTKLPQCTGIEVIKALQCLGFIKIRSTGSHARLIHRDGRKITVPVHNKPIPKGTLKSITRQANITIEELIENI